MGNNAELGISLQKAICGRYNISLHPNAVGQFESNYNPELADRLSGVVAQIFTSIGSAPVRCTTYSPSPKDGETLSPHNFILENGHTLSLRTNMKDDKVAPRVVGQCGISVFNEHFAETVGRAVEDKQQIKAVVFDNIHKMIPVFIDYMFVSDYTVWVYADNSDTAGYSFRIFDNRQSVDIEPDRDNFYLYEGFIRLG